MLKNILFDFGNVLFDLDEAETERRLSAILDPAKSADLHEQVLHPFERGEISEEAFFNRLQRRSKSIQDGIYYYKAWNAMLLGMPKSRFEMLSQLRSRYKVFLLSNINITHLRYLQKKLESELGISDFETSYFDKVYYSFQLGMRKPETEIYKYVLSDAAITAEHTLFIDDKKENIEAARQLGFSVKLHDPATDIADFIHQML